MDEFKKDELILLILSANDCPACIYLNKIWNKLETGLKESGVRVTTQKVAIPEKRLGLFGQQKITEQQKKEIKNNFEQDFQTNYLLWWPTIILMKKSQYNNVRAGVIDPTVKIFGRRWVEKKVNNVIQLVSEPDPSFKGSYEDYLVDWVKEGIKSPYATVSPKEIIEVYKPKLRLLPASYLDSTSVAINKKY